MAAFPPPKSFPELVALRGQADARSDLSVYSIAQADAAIAAGAGGSSAWIDATSAPYNATGDGTTDDRAAIQAALDAASVLGGGTVLLPPGTYLIKRPLWLASDVTLRGSGRGATTITKPATVKSLLTANASAGATSVTVADATGFEVGGAIHLSDTSSYEWLSTQGRITAIAGTTITFANDEGLGRTGIDGVLQTNRAATAYTSFPLIRNVEGSSNIAVVDLTLDQAKNANDPTNEFTIGTIHWVETYRSVVENCDLLNAPGDAYSDQAQDGTGITPAAGLIKSTRNTIRGCRVRDATRHGVHLGTCMDGAFVLGNEITNCGDDGVIGYGFALFYCAYVTNTVAAGNLVSGCGQGFAGIDARDTDNVITGNHIRNCLTWAIMAEGDGTGGRWTITGNLIVNCRGGKWSEPDTVFSGNVFNLGTKADGLQMTATAHRCQVVGNIFRGTQASGQYGLQLTGNGTTNIQDVRVANNTFRNMARGVSIRGALRMVASGNTFADMTTATAWVCETVVSTDCVIRDERNSLTTPINEFLAPVRLVYEGLGNNGTDDPATGPATGGWFGISGRRYNGQVVRWNSGGGEKFSIFHSGVGWTALN